MRRRSRSSTSGAATYGWVLDSGTDSGGGWFLEQWFGRAGEPYADNGNGRSAPATEVLFDSPTGVELLTFVQDMINDGLAVTVGDNTAGTGRVLEADRPGRGRRDDDRHVRASSVASSTRSAADWRPG